MNSQQIYDIELNGISKAWSYVKIHLVLFIGSSNLEPLSQIWYLLSLSLGNQTKKKMAGSTVAKNNILQIYLTNFNKPSWESVTLWEQIYQNF